jgi:hypothetical protein
MLRIFSNPARGGTGPKEAPQHLLVRIDAVTL